jgi:hypothetical protein
METDWANYEKIQSGMQEGSKRNRIALINRVQCVIYCFRIFWIDIFGSDCRHIKTPES